MRVAWGGDRTKVYRVALAVAFGCLLVYVRTLTCGFVNWEDQDYVINNTAIRTLDWNFLVWAFTTMTMAFWLPLTWVSFAIDYHFWGLNPQGYHLTNILLHAANAGLLVLVADRLFQAGGWKNRKFSGMLYPAMLFLVGLLWAIHPARVESVAWVTERKDVLNGLFTIGSLLFYLRYLEKKEAGADHRVLLREYLVSVLLFACSLMAKPTSVILPALLLVLDWYPLGRLRRGTIWPVLREKIPFFLFSAALTLLTLIASVGQNAMNPLSEFSLGMRLITSGNSIFEYCKLMLYPVGILPYYDLPLAIPQIYIVKALFVAIVVGTVVWWGRKVPWLAAVLISFILPLLPILQLTANGAQLVLAPRYTYLSSLLPGIILVGVMSSGYERISVAWPVSRHRAAAVLLAGVLLFYGAMTWHQIGFWQNSGAMWTRVIAYQPFERAYFYRGLYYVDTGQYHAAVDDYSTCLTYAGNGSNPEIYNIYAFRGEALSKAGRYEEAVQDFNAAIAQFPHRLYYFHRGTALQALGRTREAADDFARAGRAKGQIYWFTLGSAP